MIKIEITEEAVEFLSSQTGTDKEDALEVGEIFLGFCHKEETAPAILSPGWAFSRLQELAESKGATLYEISFRNAGVGIRFFEEARAGEKPEALDLRSIEPAKKAGAMQERTRELSAWMARGLVTYKYYTSLDEALEGETKRLKGEGFEPPERTRVL